MWIRLAAIFFFGKLRKKSEKLRHFISSYSRFLSSLATNIEVSYLGSGCNCSKTSLLWPINQCTFYLKGDVAAKENGKCDGHQWQMAPNFKTVKWRWPPKRVTVKQRFYRILRQKPAFVIFHFNEIHLPGHFWKRKPLHYWIWRHAGWSLSLLFIKFSSAVE